MQSSGMNTLYSKWWVTKICRSLIQSAKHGRMTRLIGTAVRLDGDVTVPHASARSWTPTFSPNLHHFYGTSEFSASEFGIPARLVCKPHAHDDLVELAFVPRFPCSFCRAQVLTFIIFAVISGVGIFGTTKIYKERGSPWVSGPGRSWGYQDTTSM